MLVLHSGTGAGSWWVTGQSGGPLFLVCVSPELAQTYAPGWVGTGFTGVVLWGKGQLKHVPQASGSSWDGKEASPRALVPIPD